MHLSAIIVLVIHVMASTGFSEERMLKIHVGHVWQSISLIASNAAAVLPAYWALRQKVTFPASMRLD